MCITDSVVEHCTSPHADQPPPGTVTYRTSIAALFANGGSAPVADVELAARQPDDVVTGAGRGGHHVLAQHPGRSGHE